MAEQEYVHAFTMGCNASEEEMITCARGGNACQFSASSEPCKLCHLHLHLCSHLVQSVHVWPQVNHYIVCAHFARHCQHGAAEGCECAESWAWGKLKCQARPSAPHSPTYAHARHALGLPP